MTRKQAKCEGCERVRKDVRTVHGLIYNSPNGTTSALLCRACEKRAIRSGA